MTSPAARVVLAGDVGGTHTRLALFPVPTAEGHQVGAAPPSALVRRVVVPSPVAQVDLDSPGLARRGTLEDAVVAFLGHAGLRPEAVVLACAGPVRGGQSRITNLPWVVSEARLGAGTHATRVRLVNDFEAMAYGTETLHDAELDVLQAGERSPAGARLVIGAGTGLGQGWVVPGGLGQPPRVFASEGGHQSLAPRDAFEDDLLRWLRARHGRVSVERVVSGLGLVDLYAYGVEVGAAETSAEVQRAVAERGAQAIGLHGQGTGGDPACSLALRRFVSLFGAHAGDAALGLLPAGGVVITGGIAAAVLPAMREGFIPAFLDKGRLRSVLEPLHVAVALCPDVGMRGAAALALELAR